MENKLLNIANDKELRITSVELVKIINDFRKLESEAIDKKYIALRHDNFMAKIESESKTLETLGLDCALNFKVAKYYDSQNKERPCYELNRDGMLMLLNSESTLVRMKTIEYINLLETENKKLKLESTIDKLEKLTEEAKHQYKPSHKKKLDYNRMIKSVVNTDEEVQVVKDWCFGLLGITKWEDTCIDDSKKIIETINTVATLLTIKKFKQITFLQ